MANKTDLALIKPHGISCALRMNDMAAKPLGASPLGSQEDVVYPRAHLPGLSPHPAHRCQGWRRAGRPFLSW